MTIKIGDRLPSGQIQEYVEVETAGCSIGPNRFDIDQLTNGKTIVVFGVPGAFTPTCSAQHVPGFARHYDEFRSKGVDEIWCFSVNDAFVMGAWGRDQKVGGKIRMMADGSVSTRASWDSSSTCAPAGWACAASVSRCWFRTGSLK